MTTKKEGYGNDEGLLRKDADLSLIKGKKVTMSATARRGTRTRRT